MEITFTNLNFTSIKVDAYLVDYNVTKFSKINLVLTCDPE